MIKKLVSGLPEIYQPIYGHPELSDQTSRQCTDRLAHIIRVHDTLQRLLNRPLKVLDLGCAQGFFSLNLAELGAAVHGVDFLDANIAVCNALAEEHPGVRLTFETGRVEEFIQRLEHEEYDLVLGLSVFHHLVHEHGAGAAKTLLSHAAAQSGVLMVELALREEPLYWAAAQPQDPRELLENIAFVHEYGRHETHLSSIARPLFVASNRYWVLRDYAERFDGWTTEPHSLAQSTHQGSRRYFFVHSSFLKLYRFDHPRGEYNKTEFTNEVRFLQAPPHGFRAAKIIVHGATASEAWVATQRLPGRLLLDVIREEGVIDSRAVLQAVLEQLAALESAGLYHNDVRTWNVLLSDDGAVHLIDYGAISAQARDCVWPGNLFLAFFIFVHEVVTGVVEDPNPLRTIAISPFRLPQPYRTWAESFWREPMERWSFQLMHDALIEMPLRVNEEQVADANKLWMKAIEEAMQIQRSFMQHTVAKVQQAEAETRGQIAEAHAAAIVAESRATEAESRATKAETELATVRNELNDVHQSNHHNWTQLEATRQELHQVHQSNHHHYLLSEQRGKEIEALRASLSWRITAPLRWLAAPALRKGNPTTVPPAPGLVDRAIRWGMARPQLVAFAHRSLHRYSKLREIITRRVATAMHAPVVSQRAPAATHSGDPARLTPRAHQIYADLKSAIERREAKD